MSFVKKDPQAVRAHRARLLKFAASAFTKEEMDAARPRAGTAIRSLAHIENTADGDNPKLIAPTPRQTSVKQAKGKKVMRKKARGKAMEMEHSLDNEDSEESSILL